MHEILEMVYVILITALVMECKVILSVWEVKQSFKSVSYLKSFPLREESTGFGCDLGCCFCAYGNAEK